MKIFYITFLVLGISILVWAYQFTQQENARKEADSTYFDLQYLQDSGLYIATYQALNEFTWADIRIKIDSIWLIRNYTLREGRLIRQRPLYAIVIPGIDRQIDIPMIRDELGENIMMMPAFCQRSDTIDTDRVITSGYRHLGKLGYFMEVRPYQDNLFPKVICPEDTILFRLIEKNPYPERNYLDASIHFVRKRGRLPDSLQEAIFLRQLQHDMISLDNNHEFRGKVISISYYRLRLQYKRSTEFVEVGYTSKEFLKAVQIGDSVVTTSGDSVIYLYRKNRVRTFKKSRLQEE